MIKPKCPHCMDYVPSAEYVQVYYPHPSARSPVLLLPLAALLPSWQPGCQELGKMMHVDYIRGGQNFLVKGQVVNIWVFVSQVSSVTAPQFCYSVKQPSAIPK